LERGSAGNHLAWPGKVMTDLAETFKFVGAAAGVASFVWNAWTPLRSYLVLTMDIRKPEGGEAIVKLSVENSGLTSKLISYAALTVTPEATSLADALDDLLGHQPISAAKGTKQQDTFLRLFRHAGTQPRYARQGAIIPLNELYQDQAMVGPGEKIGYACSLDLSKLRAETTYVVRFYIFVLYARFFLRWRFTADALRYSTPNRANGFTE